MRYLILALCFDWGQINNLHALGLMVYYYINGRTWFPDMWDRFKFEVVDDLPTLALMLLIAIVYLKATDYLRRRFSPEAGVSV